MLSSLKIALRSLLKSPSFTIVSLVTLGLGIGANTAMFNLTDAMLFRLAPYSQPKQLVCLNSTTAGQPGASGGFALADLEDVRAQSTSFSSVTTVHWERDILVEQGHSPERMQSLYSSPEIFSTLGVRPMLGRPFTAAEEVPGRTQVAVLSYEYWQSRFGGRPDIVGTSIRLNAEPATVIGVMPPHSQYRMFFGTIDSYRPLALAHYFYDTRELRGFIALGRLKPGVSIAQANAELGPIAARLAKDYPQTDGGHGIIVSSIQEAANGDFWRNITWALFAVSGFVLLIACANLGNLQLARAAMRTRELAIRAAIGASRWRLILHQLTESLVLALAGGGLGIFVAVWISRMLERVVVDGGDHWLELPMSGRVLAFTLVISVLTSMLFGLVPAWLASRADVNAMLKEQARGSSGGRMQQRLRHALIVSEVALALVLLAGAGMMTHNFDAYVKRDHGWDPNNLLTASVALPEATRYNADAQKIEFHRKLEARLAAIPGVEQSALGTLLPINFITDAAPMEVAGQTPVDRSQQPIGNYGMVTADYFSALRIPFVEGRAFDPDIRADSPQVIIINQSLARHFWPKGGALGQKIAELEHNKKVWREIVGVVRDVELAGNPTDTTPYYIYRPLVQSPWGIFSIVLRGPAPASFAPALRQAVADLDPDLTVDNIQTVPEAIDEGQHDIILAGRAIAGFAFLGLVLAGVGLYGVISNIVAQRTGEFGIRLALGASPNDVLRLVLRRGLWLSLLGIAIGLVGAYGAGRFLISLMPKIEGADPIGLLLVSAFLLAVALFACWVPARRATKIDPLIALRAE